MNGSFSFKKPEVDQEDEAVSGERREMLRLTGVLVK